MKRQHPAGCKFCLGAFVFYAVLAWAMLGFGIWMATWATPPGLMLIGLEVPWCALWSRYYLRGYLGRRMERVTT